MIHLFLTCKFYLNLTVYTYNYQSKHNTIYAQSVHIFHNYMFRQKYVIVEYMYYVFRQKYAIVEYMYCTFRQKYAIVEYMYYTFRQKYAIVEYMYYTFRQKYIIVEYMYTLCINCVVF
jgi:hypothetical protein